MPVVAAQLVARVSAEGTDKVKQQLTEVGNAVTHTHNSFGMLASGLTSSAGGIATAVAGVALAATGALVGIGVQSVRMAGTFQEGMTTLVTGAGEARGNLKMVSDGVLKMAVDTGTSTRQLTDGLYMIESAGYHGAAGLQVLKAAAQGAKVGNADMASVANGVTTALTDYALPAAKATAVTNDLIATVAAGKTHMADLASAMSTILPTSASVGVSLADTSAALATMTGEGTDAASASTYLRQLLMALENPAKKGAAALKEIGLSSADVSDEMKKSLPDALQMITDHLKQKFPEGSAAYVKAMADIAGGTKQMEGILQLTGTHLDVFKGNLGSITDAVKKGGDTITGWSLVQEDFNFKLSQAKEVIETLGIKIGTALLPVATVVIDKFISALQGIGPALSWIGGVLKTVDVSGFREAWKAVSVEVEEAGRKFGGMVGTLKPVGDALSPVADLIRAIASAGLSTVTDLLWQFSQTFIVLDRAAQSGTLNNIVPHIDLSALAASVKQIGQIFLNLSPAANIFDALSSHAQELGKWFQSAVVPAIKQAEPGFEELGQAVARLLPAFVTISGVVHDTFQTAFSALLPVFEKAVPLVIRISGLVADGLGKAIQFVTPYVVQAAGALGQFADAIAQRVAPIVSQWLDSLSKGFDIFLTTWRTIWPTLAPALKATWDEIATVVGVAWDLVSGIIKIGLDVLGGNWKQAWTDCKDMLVGIWDSIKGYLHTALEGVVAQFQPLLEALAQIPGPAGDMARKVLDAFTTMKTGTVQHAETMKAAVLEHTAQMHIQAASHFEQMRLKLVDQIKNTSDPVKKHALEMKLGVVRQVEEMHIQAANSAQNMAHKVVEHAKTMHGQSKDWFSNMRDTIQNTFGNIGTWFADRFQEAKKGVTDAFGTIGKWFEDRWKDIQNVFSGIGTWFADRWNEVYAPLKPIIKFVEEVFQTIWNIIVAIVEKIVKWLQDHWKGISDDAKKFWDTIATTLEDTWNGIVANLKKIFEPIGKWLADRWQDIKNDVSTAWKGISDTIEGWWKKITDTTNDKTNGIKDSVLTTFGKIRDSIGGIIKSFANSIVDQLNNAIAAVTTFLNGVGDGLNAIAKSLGTQGTIQHVRIDPIPHYASGTSNHPGGPALVGEHGRELVMLPRGASVLSNDKTESLLKNGLVPGYASGIGDALGDITSWIAGGTKSILDHLFQRLNLHLTLPGDLASIAGGAMDTVKNWALSFVQNMLPTGGMGTFSAQGVTIPGNLASWIAAAMGMTGVPSNWATALATIALHESGGDPGAVNNWDSNAAMGDPSRGLFQTIGATFAAYMLPGHGNILNPVDNTIAAIRYIQARYGSVFNVPGILSLSQGGPYVGYAEGTDNASGGWSMVGERGPEAMYVPRGAQIMPHSGLNDLATALHRLATALERSASPNIYLDGQRVSSALMPHIVDGIRYNSAIFSY